MSFAISQLLLLRKWKTCPELPKELPRTSRAREGGKDTPFVTYYTDNDHLIIMEILDVKQCSWPEPSDKVIVDPDVSCRCLSQSFAVHEETKNLSRDQVWTFPTRAGTIFLHGRAPKGERPPRITSPSTNKEAGWLSAHSFS